MFSEIEQEEITREFLSKIEEKEKCHWWLFE